jgi:hypothetical protein
MRRGSAAVCAHKACHDRAKEQGLDPEPIVGHLYHAVRLKTLEVAHKKRLQVRVKRGRIQSLRQLVVRRVLGHADAEEGRPAEAGRPFEMARVSLCTDGRRRGA